MIMPGPRDPSREPEPEDERRGCLASLLGWSGFVIAALLLAVALVTGHLPA